MRQRPAQMWETVRTSVWFLPSAFVLVGALLAFLLVSVEGGAGEGAMRRLPLLFRAGPDGARGMLQAIAASVLGLAGIAFSSTLVVLSLSASTYSQGILRHFTSDRDNQVALGSLLSTFVYCLLVLRTVRAGDDPFVPTLAVTGAVVLALLDLGVFVYFIGHLAQSIQASTIAEDIAENTRRVIDQVLPERARAPGDRPDDSGTHDRPHGVAVAAPRSGYIQFANPDELLNLATGRNLMLWMERGIGDSVAEGAALATLAPRDGADGESIRWV